MKLYTVPFAPNPTKVALYLAERAASGALGANREDDLVPFWFVLAFLIARSSTVHSFHPRSRRRNHSRLRHVERRTGGRSSATLSEL